MNHPVFDPDCQLCPRLAAFCRDTRKRNPGYHGAAVDSFGALGSKLLVVGLAPGMHGANASGRPFTGDYAGVLLYQALFDHGFSSCPESVSRDDGLQLTDCRITNAVKCLPPQNKPVASEVNNCNRFLRAELDTLPAGGVILALGTLAHGAVLKALGCRKTDYAFSHQAVHELPEKRYLVDSYHCSRYNVQTKRLTAGMFDEVFQTVRQLM